MTRLTKFILIVMIIISFSCFITTLVAPFMGYDPRVYWTLSAISFFISWSLNQDILDKEPQKIEEIDEVDETYFN